MKQASASLKKYNFLVHPDRAEFLTSRGVNFLAAHQNQRELHAATIIWTAFSIKMTEQVESWIKKAGEQCELKSHREVGSQLKIHAEQEADHDLMLIDDLSLLIGKWNVKYNDNLTPKDIFSLPPPKSAKDYILLHENTYQGAHPYAQVAIEFEIERISVLYGPKIIENVLYTLGEDFEKGLSFITDHVVLDQGHTKFNRDLMEKCFNDGASLEALAQAGSVALRIYKNFLIDCVDLSSTLAQRKTKVA